MISRSAEDSAGKDTQNRIIEYWNKALLCSLDSSTSHADPDLAYLDNAIENRILEQFLSVWAVDCGNCMDVGAGYGRFAGLLGRFYSRVVLLEPANRIYKTLRSLWGQDPKIECYNCDFESYIDSRGFDLIFTSGVLYLYGDEMLEYFARKAISMLNENGILLIRDFVSVPNRQVVQSSYVENGFCYYRPPAFWDALANRLGVKLFEVRRSKPSFSWLRNRYLLSLLGVLGLKGIYRRQIIINSVMRFGNFHLVSRGINTVFIGMKL